LSSQEIQELLDRQLTPREEAAARAHLDVCARCRGEAEGWALLFSDLQTLPELEPGPAFQQVVLDQSPTRLPVGQRARGWLAARESGKREEVHVPATGLQDYLEGRLQPQPRFRVEAHLATCPTCKEEAHEWRALMDSFESLKRLAPSAGFRERVMAQVMVPAPVPARADGWFGIRGRLRAWARSLAPESRKGWAVVGGVASAPTITLAALIYLVFSRPMVTPGAIGSYVFWKVSALLGSLASAMSTYAMENGTLRRVITFFEPLAQSPALLGLGGVGISLLSAAALWVLYRNLIATPTDGHHARARV